MTPAVVCIGAVTFDLVAAVDESLGDDGRVVAADAVIGSGGPSATAAVALVRLGVPTAFVGTVGDDEAGGFVRRELEREGVDAGELRTVAGLTAMSPIVVNRRTAHRAIAAYYGTVGAPVLSERAIALCRKASWVHLDHVGALVLPELRASGVSTPVSVDAGNPTPGLDLHEVSLYGPTEARIGERYPGLSLRAAMRRSLADGAETVVVTRGSAGSLAITRGTAWAARAGRLVQVPSLPVEVASTLGAGDVFHGALLAAHVRGLTLADALRVANAAASLSCRGLDGRSAIPGWAEALALAGTTVPPLQSE